MFAIAVAPSCSLPLTHYVARHARSESPIDRAAQLAEVRRLITEQRASHEPIATRHDANWLLGSLARLAVRAAECGGWPMLGRHATAIDLRTSRPVTLQPRC